jgi:hypothetical protein
MWPYFIFLMVWFASVGCVVWWVTRRVLPSIEREMDEQGLNDVQKQMILTKAMYPPKFRK